MDKYPLFSNNSHKSTMNMNKSKEEIVNNLFDEKDNTPNMLNNIQSGKSSIQPQICPDELMKGYNQIPNSYLSPKTPDDAYRIANDHSHFNRPDGNQEIIKTFNNHPEEQQTYIRTALPESAEEIAKKNKDINFDIILSSLKDDKFDNNIIIEKNYKKDDKKIIKTNSSKDNYHINLKNELKSEIPYGKTPSVSQKFLNYMKNLVLNDVTLVQIKFNIMKLESNSIIKSNHFDEESIIKTIPSIFEEAFLNIDISEIKEQFNSYEITYLERLPLTNAFDIENLNNSIGLMKKLEFNNGFRKYRKIVSDGNGFFRAFMINYVENMIITNNIILLKKFIISFYSTDDMVFKKNNIIIDKSIFMAIFCIIIEYLEKGDIKKGYDLFIKSIYLFRIDIYLIKYMRITLSIFIEANIEAINNFLYKNNSLEYFLITPYFTNDNHEIDLKRYFNESLLNLNCQADKFLLFITPLAFDSNICLYFFDTNSLIQDYLFPSIDTFKHQTINIFYNCFDYYILYNYTLVKLVNEIIYPNETAEIVNKFYCEECRSETDVLLFNYIKDFFYCKECVRKLINSTLTNRVLHFLNENYFNLEYYSRPINFFKERYICDEECLYLTGKTLSQYILGILSTHVSNSVCLRCGNIEDSLKFTCGCKCKNCMINYIESFTQNKVILNYYEKKMSSIVIPSKCYCGGFFNYDVTIELMHNDITAFTEKAFSRLKEKIKKSCMFCGRQINNNQKSHYVELYKDQKISDPHIICSSCFRNNIRIRPRTIFCVLCGFAHEISDNVFPRRKNEDACCKIF